VIATGPARGDHSALAFVYLPFTFAYRRFYRALFSWKETSRGGSKMHPVAHYRLARGWTQQTLADRVGVGREAVRAWEEGTLPEPALLRRLADALGMDALGLAIDLETWSAETAAVAAG
jgi:DNA-binding XRE family transcriptional regulator